MGYLRIARDDLTSSFARKLRYAHTRARKRKRERCSRIRSLFTARMNHRYAKIKLMQRTDICSRIFVTSPLLNSQLCVARGQYAIAHCVISATYDSGYDKCNVSLRLRTHFVFIVNRTVSHNCYTLE